MKFTSKLWTNIEKNTIEGESNFQILDKNYDLQYEMKDIFRSENILTKEGSLKNRTIQVTKLVPVKEDKDEIVPGEPVAMTQEVPQKDQDGIDMGNPEFDIFQNTNVTTIKSQLNTTITMQPVQADASTKKMVFEEVIVDHVVPDKYLNDQSTLISRDIKIELV